MNAPQPRTTARPRGRPADMASGELQERLLDTAETLFAEHGYAATSVRQLAGAAGVNPALVHYYFGSKRALLRAVMARALEPMAQALATMQSEDTPKPGDIAGLLFGMARRHPAIPRLIVREVMLSGGDIKDEFIEHFAPRLGGALPGLLRRQQQSGRMRADLDPGIATLMLLALSVFPFIARPLAEPVLGIRFDEDGAARYAEQLQLLIEEGLIP